MTERIFKHKKPLKDKLISYGFLPFEKGFTYTCPLKKIQMELTVTVETGGKVNTRLIDKTTEDEYVLHLVKNASGSFIGSVKDEYEKILTHIANNCFTEEVFKAPQSKRVIAYFRNKYGDELEHLWADAPDNAIVRRKDTKKWYAAILTVSRKKLYGDSEEKVEIIDLHAKTEDIENLVDFKKYFPGFHMNKKHWITVILDDTLTDTELFEIIDQSYELGKKK